MEIDWIYYDNLGQQIDQLCLVNLNFLGKIQSFIAILQAIQKYFFFVAFDENCILRSLGKTKKIN